MEAKTKAFSRKPRNKLRSSNDQDGAPGRPARQTHADGGFQAFSRQRKSPASNGALSERLPLQTEDLYTLKDEPQPHVLFTFGFSNLKPAPSNVST
jgi:hypothetical protein